MKTQDIRSLYDQFTPEERVRLVLAACARKDANEVARLNETCPRVTLPVADPAYTALGGRMWDAVVAVLARWLDVSHRVLQTRQKALFLDTIVSFYEVSVRGARASTKELKRQYRAAMVGADVQYKHWSAIWKAIEAAITRFCADRDLTTEQLFAMVKSLPPAIDEARANLDPDVPADPLEEAAVYQRLCDIVSGHGARGSGEPQSPR